MIGWLRRCWISRRQHDAVGASYETHIALLEAALTRYEQNTALTDIPENLSLELLKRLEAKIRKAG